MLIWALLAFALFALALSLFLGDLRSHWPHKPHNTNWLRRR